MADTNDDNTIAPDTLFLVDGSGYIFRAYHALPPLTRPDGTPIGAVYGFTTMLMKLLEDMNAPLMAVIFDAARKNFRYDIYPEYKANRDETPEDLKPQFPLVRESAEAFNLPAIEMEGFEADDLIATYARLAREQGHEVVIVSSDKDLMQLIEPGVRMYDPMKGRFMGEEAVMDKFGVTPDKVVDIQSLAGDSVDNVPGVPGIGVKTAALLINEYGDLDTLLERAGEIKQPKRRENLINHAEDARISRKLVSLDRHVDVVASIDDFKTGNTDPDTLKAFVMEQGFKALPARIDRSFGDGQTSAPLASGDAPKQDPLPSTDQNDYVLIQDADTLKTWLSAAEKAGIMAVDTETTALTPAAAELVGVSIAIHPGKAAYIPLTHKSNDPIDLLSDGPTEEIVQIPMEDAIALLKPALEDPSILKIGQNIKYDLQILAAHDIAVAPVDDTMLLSYVLDGTEHKHNMDDLADIFCGHKTIKFKEVAGTGKSQVTFDYVPLDKALDYAAEDAEITLRLHKIFKPRLLHEHMTNVYETLERPLIPVIANMEREGIKVDPAVLNNLSQDFAKKLAMLESEIHELAGTTFNIASPKQMGKILFEDMGYEGGKKTKTGDWSTSASLLEKLAADGNEIVEKILEWRGLSKLKSTYTDSLQAQMNAKTGRVHTSFSMAVTSTGRLSSSDPNLQNIPIRTEDGRKIRTAFIAEKGCKLLSIDYSQVELRLIAHMAGVDALKDAFKNDIDIHAKTASEVFGVPLDQMTPEIRRNAKAINFGIVYGISAFGLAKQLGCDVGEAAGYIKTYFARFPEIPAFMEQSKEFARAHGYVETLFGRKCTISGINDKNGAVRAFAERQAINAPLQGTAADIIKHAMIKVPPALKAEKLKAKMLLQVHDELIFEVPEDQLEATQKLVTEIMENIVDLDIPLIAEGGTGDNWDEAH